ncbi:MAG: SH3 domain-containing protein [Paracoccaceae bacterium]|nr:SH3 domain-containing protein [Paracoccaceae bacterium]
MLRAAALVLVALAAPASATVDGWPALYDVAGVAEADMLNIRAEPSAGSEIIGRLAPGARAVEVVDISPDGRWGLVNAGEGSGWVSLAFLKRRAGQWAGLAPETARCFGNEPFWSLAYGDKGAVFESPDALPLEFAESLRLRSRNRIDRHAHVYENDLGGFVATFRNATCSDGMSDRVYGWGVDLLLVVAGDENAQLFSGCCTIGP